MKQIDEQHMLRYLRKISENTERIAKALEARNNPNQRRNVKDTLEREPKSLNEQLDDLDEALAVAKAISEG